MVIMLRYIHDGDADHWSTSGRADQPKSPSPLAVWTSAQDEVQEFGCSKPMTPNLGLS